MIELRIVHMKEAPKAMEIINMAKEHLKRQGIDQWQTGYPDYACIRKDIAEGKGFFLVEEENILGYLCIDYDGEPAYDNLNGSWQTGEKYVVVHRMAFLENARGRGLSDIAFQLVEEMSREKGIDSFRVDTDEEWYGCSDGTTTRYMKLRTKQITGDFLTFARHTPVMMKV